MPSCLPPSPSVTHDNFALPDGFLAAFEAESGLTVAFVYGIDNTFASRVIEESLFANYAAPRRGRPMPPPKPLWEAPEPGTFDASVLITLATVDPDTGGLLLGGYVSGVMEDGGDCQYVVTSASGDSLTVHKDGVENNGSTSCGSTTVAKSRVQAGSYTVVLRYVNDIGEAVSDPVEVELP